MAVENLTVDEIKDLSWVQCEKQSCLKWRRISREDIGTLVDGPWFCPMNKDSSHNKCEDPEEDHRRTIHKADKCGYRYIFSQLSKGALVWAKMTGYASWPAILSPDPSNGSYVTLAEETGSPLQYHVEFLGQPHTHCWVYSCHVETYGHKTTRDESRKACKKTISRQSIIRKAPKKAVRVIRLQASIDEAETLKSLTCEERLLKCIFTYSPQADLKKAAQPNAKASNDEGKQTVSGSAEKADAVNADAGINVRQRKRGRPRKSQCSRDCCACETTCSPHLAPKKSKKVSFIGQPEERHVPSNEPWASSSSDESPCQEVPEIIQTKEERLQADIKILRRAEEKFDRRLRRFCTHHGIPVKNTGPQWQGRQVSKYQVYMAVQERGGYNMVSAGRAWSKVYHEVCGTSPGSHQSVSSAVKTYYSRNLLPYELYELQSSQECQTSKAMPPKTKSSKKHKKHKPKYKGDNRESRPTSFPLSNSTSLNAGTDYDITGHYRPISSQGPNYGPMASLGQNYQPANVTCPQPMGRGSNVCPPVSTAILGGDVSRYGGNTEGDFKPWQGSQHQRSPTEAFHTAGQEYVDVDFLAEESTQALQELQELERMLVPTGGQTMTRQQENWRLDRATHIEPAPNPTAFPQKPVLLEFYSMQYDDPEYSFTNQQATTRLDDTHQVPDIRAPLEAATGSAPIAALPQGSKVTGQEEMVSLTDMYSSILLDMDTMGDKIDRLNEELSQDWIEL